MDINSIPLLTVMKRRLNWLTQRQGVLAQNIANADTPRYRPKDLKPFKFQRLMRSQSSQLAMKVTLKSHLAGGKRPGGAYKVVTTAKPYETSPTGNAVVLEEQMMKVSETGMGHRLATELYKKHLGMLKIAIGRDR